MTLELGFWLIIFIFLILTILVINLFIFMDTVYNIFFSTAAAFNERRYTQHNLWKTEQTPEPCVLKVDIRS